MVEVITDWILDVDPDHSPDPGIFWNDSCIKSILLAVWQH